MLELTGSRHLTVKSLEYIKESLPELGHLSIEMEPPAGVKTVEDLYKINKIARRMFRRLKEDLRIVLNDWTKQTPSVPVVRLLQDSLHLFNSSLLPLKYL